MFLDTTFRLYPKINEEIILHRLISNFEFQINEVISKYVEKGIIFEIPYKEIDNSVPWHSKIEIIKQAKINFKRANKHNDKICFSGSYCKWTSMNFKFLSDQRIIIETFRKDVMILDMFANDFTSNIINNNKLVSLKIFKRKNKWMGTLTYVFEERKNNNKEVMGIDLGILVPAVVVTSNDKVRFFGNGREKRFIHTKQKAIYQKLLKNGEVNKVNSWTNRLKDIDHKISCDIVRFAIENNVGTIKMEQLSRIQQKNTKSIRLSTWSYHRLMMYIIYKAKKEGINVYLVKPYNTSRKCPKCTKLNTTKDRHYSCDCGFKGHRDIVGALNILNSPYSHSTSP